MSIYSLQRVDSTFPIPARFVRVLCHGKPTLRAASCELKDVPRRGIAATVHVPYVAYLEAQQRFQRDADFVADDGTRLYDFTSHEDALAFMAWLYGIDAHDAALLLATDTQHDTESQAAAIPSASPAVSHGIFEVPNASARNVVLTPPVLLGTTARAIFLGTPLIHTRRITQ